MILPFVLSNELTAFYTRPNTDDFVQTDW